MEKKNIFKRIVIIIFLILVGIFLYARYLNTKGLKVVEYAVINEALPSSFNGIKIVQFSDIHYGNTTDLNDIKKLVKTINSLKPDIIFFTGDLYDKNVNIPKKEIKKLTNELKKLQPSLYKYATVGDGDKKYYTDYQNIINDTGFILLNNSNELLYYKDLTPIKIVGLSNDKKLNEAFKTDYENELYTIALFHKPDMIDELNEYNINLAFVGHSLGGQLRVPFLGGLIKRSGAKKYYEGKYTVDKTTLYVNSGIGTEDIPLRTFNKPSINLYRLYTK